MPAKKHNFTATEFKAGLMVLVSAVIFVLFVAVINGMRVPTVQKHFHTFLPDTKGLNKGAAVRFGGAKVGRVDAVRVNTEGDQSLIRMDFTVDADVPINEAGEAFISAVSLTSEKHLEVSTGTKEAKLLADGAEVPSRPGDLFEQADQIASRVLTLLKKVDRLTGVDDQDVRVTQEGAAKTAQAAATPPESASAPGAEAAADGDDGSKKLVTIAQILGDVDDTVNEGQGMMKDARQVIGDSRDDLDAVLRKIQEIEDSAKSLVGDLQGMVGENRPAIKDTVAGVHQTVDRVNHVAGKLDELRASLQGTLDNAKTLSADAQGLLEHSRPTIEDMIIDLRDTVRNLKVFAATIAEQPQAVLRGATAHGRE